MQFAHAPALLVLISAAAVLAGCGDHPAAEAGSVPPPIENCTDVFECAARTQLAKVEPTELDGLHNVFRLSDHISTGGEPLTDGALKAVAGMGVKTILSVDGKAPNVELAKQLGMRYVHVPIRYGGLTRDEMFQIAKTFRELEGPFYVHCFHGKHRGPAAAAIGRVVLDGAPREQGLAEMRQWCGTASKYSGLYKAIATGDIPSEKETADYAWDFPAKHEIQGVRAGMVRMTRSFDNVQWLAKKGWKTDAEHPDIDAVRETEHVVQHFEQMLALPDNAERPADYRAWMDESMTAVRELAKAVRAFADGDEAAAGLASKKLVGAKDLCSACHKLYRNK